MPRFEEPEECVDGVVLVEVHVVQGVRWEVDVAGEGFDVGSCFAYSWLYTQNQHGRRNNVREEVYLFVRYGHAFCYVGLDHGETLARRRKVLRRDGSGRCQTGCSEERANHFDGQNATSL